MSSRFELFDEPKVVATVSTPNGASELYLIDRSFNEVARGVGKLELPVVPGPYRVRERVGDVERVSKEFKVASQGPADITLDGVAYDSPLPIFGTATYQHLPQLQQRRRAGSGVRIVVRDPHAAQGASGTGNVSLMEEVGRLRVETLLGERATPVSTTYRAVAESGVFMVDISLDPGSYALVQDGPEGRQTCMALYVMPDWYPAIYLLLPAQPNPDTGRRRLRLADASLFYVARDAKAPPNDVELARLEAARHALSRGRPIGGWAALPDVHGNPVFNPLIALIDAYLLLPGKPDADDDPVAPLIEGAQNAFGANFPDVQALKIARDKAIGNSAAQGTGNAQPVPASLESVRDSLRGPPILSKSWRYLLDACNALKVRAPALSFEFSVEPSESWFIWSENIGARTKTLAAAACDTAPDEVTSTKLLALSREIFETVAFSEQGRKWVDLVEEIASRELARGERLFADPAMQRIVAALAMVTDPILQKTFKDKPGELVERAWATLQVPNEVLRATLRRFSDFLVKNELLTGLVLVVGWKAAKIAYDWVRKPGDAAGDA